MGGPEPPPLELGTELVGGAVGAGFGASRGLHGAFVGLGLPVEVPGGGAGGALPFFQAGGAGMTGLGAAGFLTVAFALFVMFVFGTCFYSSYASFLSFPPLRALSFVPVRVEVVAFLAYAQKACMAPIVDCFRPLLFPSYFTSAAFFAAFSAAFAAFSYSFLFLFSSFLRSFSA